MAPLDVVLVLISSLSAFFDFRIRKIPNWLIVIGAVSGLILNAFAGVGQLLQSVAGLLVGVLVLLLPFSLGWIGAGDVKFFGVVGALLGLMWLPRVFFYSALVAGLIAVSCLAAGSARFARCKELWMDFKLVALSYGNVAPDPVWKRTGRGGVSVPWGVAFALGTIIAYYFDSQGRWAGF